MANVLSLDKRQQVIGLGQLGWSLRRIQEATGVRRETVSDYLKAAGIPVRLPRKRKLRRDGREAKAASRENPVTDSAGAKAASRENPVADSADADAAKAASLPANPVTDSGANPASRENPVSDYPRRRRQSGPASICEPYREIIEEALRQGRNGMAIYQDLVGEHGFRGAYSAVRRYLWWAKGAAHVREAHPVITTAPGEEAQVDYGDGPMVRDAFGKYRRTRLFVMTLAHSRKSVRLLTWKSSTKIWAELHERAFRRLGGCPKVIVLDNLREGVLEPDIWDPKLNPLYRDMLRHYGAVALPCRVRHPDRKGKVESAIGHTQKTPLRGKRFDAIELAQEYLDNWETKWADTRIHGTTQRQVAAMFAEEKPHLAPLPLEPFRYYQYGKRTVELNGHVRVDQSYYSTPPGTPIGSTVWVEWDSERVRIKEASTGRLLREHVKQEAKGRFVTLDEDRPAKTPPSAKGLLHRAARVGKHVGALASKLYAEDSVRGVNRVRGLIALAKKYGPAVADRACREAIELGVADYRFVRRMLERRLGPQLTLRQVDPLIRELTEYRDFIQQLTKGAGE
jgi:transposase